MFVACSSPNNQLPSLNSFTSAYLLFVTEWFIFAFCTPRAYFEVLNCTHVLWKIGQKVLHGKIPTRKWMHSSSNIVFPNAVSHEVSTLGFFALNTWVAVRGQCIPAFSLCSRKAIVAFICVECIVNVTMSFLCDWSCMQTFRNVWNLARTNERSAISRLTMHVKSCKVRKCK